MLLRIGGRYDYLDHNWSNTLLYQLQGSAVDIQVHIQIKQGKKGYVKI